ncbi:hypothetical protein [Furfurilactobacillus curtus]|uniref:Uncharacterized protein n=1 Tax=Furfurilactobacillus curtus TaxID=1746200 RepID=A0ABQ5JMX8_9LACO
MTEDLKKRAHEISVKIEADWKAHSRRFDYLFECAVHRYLGLNAQEAMELTKIWLEHPERNIDVAIMISDYAGTQGDQPLRTFARESFGWNLSDKDEQFELFGEVAVRRAIFVSQKQNLIYQRNLANKLDLSNNYSSNRYFRKFSNLVDRPIYGRLLLADLSKLEPKYREALSSRNSVDEEHYKYFCKLSYSALILSDDEDGRETILPLLKHLFFDNGNEKFWDSFNCSDIEAYAKYSITTESSIKQLLIENSIEDERLQLPIAMLSAQQVLDNDKERLNAYNRSLWYTTSLTDLVSTNSMVLNHEQHLQLQAINQATTEAIQYLNKREKTRDDRTVSDLPFAEVLQPDVMAEKLGITAGDVRKYNLVLFYHSGIQNLGLSESTIKRLLNENGELTQTKQAQVKKRDLHNGKLIWLMLHPEEGKTKLARELTAVRKSLTSFEYLDAMNEYQRGTYKVQQLFVDYMESGDRLSYKIEYLSQLDGWSKNFIYRSLYQYWFYLYKEAKNSRLKYLRQHDDEAGNLLVVKQGKQVFSDDAEVALREQIAKEVCLIKPTLLDKVIDNSGEYNSGRKK